MKLLTKQIEMRFAEIGSQEALGEQAVVIAKFFTPDGGWTWYPIEFENGMFFGLVSGLEVELGYFSLGELEKARGPMGLPIERDLHWKERTVADVRRALSERCPI